MTLAELIEELALIVRDDNLEPRFKGWINAAILTIATDFDLPTLRILQPTVFPVTSSFWVYDLPTDYHKNLFRVVDENYNRIKIFDELEYLENLDLEHVDVGDHVSHVATNEESLCVYPKADDSLRLWYYKRPTELVNLSDIPTCIPEAFQERVIIPKVVIKNFRILQDLMVDAPHQSIGYWEEIYRNGLFGSPKGEIGMINFFNKKSGTGKISGGRNPLP